MLKRNRLFLVAVLGATAMAAVAEHACVTWLPYDNSSSTAHYDATNTNNTSTSIVQTKHHIACRVPQRILRKQKKSNRTTSKLFHWIAMSQPLLAFVDGGPISSSGHKHQQQQQEQYAFGTMDKHSEIAECVLHTSQYDNAHSFLFDVAVFNHTACEPYYWASLAFDVDPLGPNIVTVGHNHKDGYDIGICKVKANENSRNDSEAMGRLFLQGERFGHCGYVVSSNESKERTEERFIGGNFFALSAIRRSNNDPVVWKNDNQQRTKAVDALTQRIRFYITKQQQDLISSISGHSFSSLLTDLYNRNVTSTDVLIQILSTDRFIAHPVLNTKGLSLLRAVLAEKMTLARRRRLGMHRHADAAAWERDGVLLKDFDHYKSHPQELEELLQMVAASQSVPVSEFQWVERNVTSVANDPQREPHIDTFHSVVKMWVYERGVVTKDTGPLHFMRGSHRNTKSKLQWIYNVSFPPATDAIKEPSLRFRGDESAMMDILRPVLPLESVPRTLIIADTSGIHHRGPALPGTVRRTIRLSSGNDGGLARLNPFDWEGWDNPPGTDVDEQLE